MRAFLGIPIPAELTEELFIRTAALRDASPGVTWVKPDNYHITMLFLGEIEEAETARVKIAIETLRIQEEKQATFGEPGQFPPRGLPRVVYAGLDEGRGCCLEIYRQLTNALPAYAQGRGYTPHITLGRVKRGRHVSLHLKAVTFPDDPFPLEEVVLYQSILHQNGAEYRRVHAKVL